MDLIIPKRRQNQGNLAALLVALYLVLLAFFILLNAISKKDTTRSQKVVDSLQDTFTRPVTQEIEAPEWLEEPGLDAVVQDFFDELEAALSVLAPLEKLEIIRRLDSITVRLPTGQLFVEEQVALRPAQALAIERFSGIILRWKDTIRLEIEMLIGTRSLQTDGPAMALAISRSGTLARALLSNGIAASHINPGLDPAMQGMTEITFVVRETMAPFAPLGKETQELGTQEGGNLSGYPGEVPDGR